MIILGLFYLNGGDASLNQIPATYRPNYTSSSSSSSIGTTTLVGFRPAQLSLNILSRKILQSAVASGTSNPQLGGELGI
jgi:hypothetical protein